MQQVHSPSNTDPRVLRKSGFAKHINVSPGRVTQMISAGMPVEADGRLDVAKCKLWIRDNVSPTRAAAQATHRDQEMLPFAAEPDAAAERRRRERINADIAERKLMKMDRELVEAREVERTWAGILRQVRSGVLAAPSRIRQVLPHLTVSDIEAIDQELRRVLEEVSDAE